MATFPHPLWMYGIPDFGTMDIHVVEVSDSTVLILAQRVRGAVGI